MQFINDCLNAPNLPLTNGEQYVLLSSLVHTLTLSLTFLLPPLHCRVVGGSCNPTPMGQIVAQAKAPVSPSVFYPPLTPCSTYPLGTLHLQSCKFTNPKVRLPRPFLV